MIVKQHGGVLPWAAMPLTAGNDRKKAAALISQNRRQATVLCQGAWMTSRRNNGFFYSRWATFFF